MHAYKLLICLHFVIKLYIVFAVRKSVKEAIFVLYSSYNVSASKRLTKQNRSEFDPLIIRIFYTELDVIGFPLCLYANVLEFSAYDLNIILRLTYVVCSLCSQHLPFFLFSLHNEVKARHA